MIRAADGGVDLAISHFGLVSSQTGKTRSEIIEAPVEAATDETQRGRVQERLKEAGWLKRGGIFGLGSIERADDDG
jgi:hypothetical protein